MGATDWSEVSIADLQAAKRWALNGGPFGSKLVSRDYVEFGVPVIRGANLPNDKRFAFDDFVFVSEEKADELLANNAQPGDVVFTQRGTLGQVGIIPEDSPFPRFVISQSQMKLTVDRARVDAMWLFYCFRDPSMQQEMINRASSSGVPHINLGVLREFKLRLPPLPEQRRIASILSAYDDLIENNTRRIAILEEMARRIYEEWFVRFRFPGHEGVRMVESELGLVPEGWVTRPFDEIATFVNGYAFKPEDWAKDGLPIIKIKELKAGVQDNTPRFAGTLADRYRIRHGDLLFSWSADLDVYVWGDSEGWLNQHLFLVQPIGEATPRSYLFHSLKAAMPAFRTRSNGATMKHIKRSALSEVRAAVPPIELAAAFEGIVRPLHELVMLLTRKNLNLRTTRDLLLPKLISGELDVSALPEPEAVVA